MKFVQPTIKLKTPYITLGQFLKINDVISSGGQAKYYLAEHCVYVNDQREQRRGRKLYGGDVITLPNIGTTKLT